MTMFTARDMECFKISELIIHHSFLIIFNYLKRNKTIGSFIREKISSGFNRPRLKLVANITVYTAVSLIRIT